MTKEFFDKYQELKQNERWKEVILLGNEALKINDLESKPEISLIIASCHHYLGKYQKTIEFAEESLGILEKNHSENQDSKGRSLYLMSAAYRNLAIGSNKSEKDYYSTESHEYIEFALHINKESELKIH